MTRNTQFSVAVHLCVALAFRQANGGEGPVSSEELAASVNTNAAYLRRVIARLVKAGVLRSQAGKQGGVLLARAADRVTLADIYEGLGETTVLPVHLQATNQHCRVSCGIKHLVEDVARAAQAATLEVLRRTSVAALVQKI